MCVEFDRLLSSFSLPSYRPSPHEDGPKPGRGGKGMTGANDRTNRLREMVAMRLLLKSIVEPEGKKEKKEEKRGEWREVIEGEADGTD